MWVREFHCGGVIKWGMFSSALRCAPMAVTEAPRVSTVAAEREPAALRLHPTRRRARVVWSLAGVLLIAGCALGFGVLAQQLADRDPIVVLGRPLPRGGVITAADLAVAQVAADAGVAVVPASDSADLVGRALLTSLPAGALLHDDLLAPAGLQFDATSRTVGLELAPGGYPTTALAAGDVVSVVLTSGSGSVLTDDAVVAQATPAAEGATTLLVSIVVDGDAAPRVAAAAGQDQVRLVLHGAGR